MAEDTTELLQVRARVDRASFQQAEQIVKRFERGALGALGKESAEQLRSVYNRVAQAANQATRSIEEGNAALRERGSIVERVDDGARRLGGGQNVAGGVDRAGTLGSQIFGALGQSELANAAGFVGDFAGAVEQAGAKAALGVVGMAALSAAIAFFQSQNDRAAQTVRNLISTQEAYYETVLTGTREQVQSALEAQQAEADVLRARIAENQAIFASLEAQIGGAGRALSDAFNLAGARELREETQRLEQQLGATEFQIARYTNALNSNATAANDAAAAVARAQEAYANTVVSGANELLEAAQRNAQFEQLSSEAARERLEALEREQAALQENIVFLEQFANGNEQIAQTLEERRAQLQDLNLQEQELTEILNTTITQREAETAALNRQTAARQSAKEALLREIEAAKQSREQIAQAQSRISDIQARGAQDIARVQGDLARKEQDVARDTAQKRSDIVEGFQRDERESFIQYARERARIERDSARGSLEAVGNRDALALLQARRAREEQLRDLEENTADERRQRSEAAELQIREAQRTAQQQIAEARRGANEQINAIRQRVNADIAAQRTIIANAQNSLNARVRLEQSGYTAMGNASVAFAQKLTQVAAAIGNLKVNMPAAQNTPTATSAGGVSDAALKGLARALRG